MVGMIACLGLFVVALIVAAEAAAKVRRLEKRLDYYMDVRAAQRNRAQRKRIAEKYLHAGSSAK